MKIEIVAVEKLVPYAQNARTHSDSQVAQIAASVKEFGFCNPVLIDGACGIIAGHGRVLAARKLGMVDVPCIRLPQMSETQKRAYALADNKLPLNAGWDDELLRVELEALKVDGFDLNLIGFDAKELASLSLPAGDQDAEPQIDKSEELREKWGVEGGQLWRLGEHRILCGDSARVEDVTRVMAGEKATLVFTDPPYGVAIGAKNRMLNSFQPSERNLTDMEYDQVTPGELKKMLLACFRLVRTICADDCSVFVCSPQDGKLGMMTTIMQEVGMEVRHVLIWAKNCATFSLGRLDYDYQHESILFTWIKKHKRNMGGQFKTSLWTVDKPRKCKEHPTMKPVELPENAILNHTDPGDVVYEPFSGSGTTILASERTRRKCRAIEISPGYVAVAIQRWADATGKIPEIVDA